tara:strand:+ start:9563 stop:11938 length:2376 start_codon:yes stop_codon:yes gene_type:complete
MIFDTDKKKDVEQIGDIKNNNVSIDTNNIDFIVTILSTNLYSKPIESFIRETVSNAWDSHVEAGVDEPVILELGQDTEGNEFCRIQDFGVGLSPERFNSVYKNIGSSTKRSDNTQIGGFGIGRFSALAYSDVVHITSVYGGKKYIYMMYKDGNSISIDMLHENTTKERNGLEVKLQINPGDFDNFAEAIKSQLVYFENLYVLDTAREDVSLDYRIDIQKDYNTFSIKKYKNFWVNSLDRTKEINLLLGKVRYPVRLSSLDDVYSSKVGEYPISLLFDIGDLDVTPNREEVLYSAKNKATIEAKLTLALAEIGELIMKEKTKDYNKIPEFIEAIDNTQYLSLLTLEDEEDVKLKLTDSKRNLTLNGESFDIKSFSKMYDIMMSYHGVYAQYTLKNNKIKYENREVSMDSIKKFFTRYYISDFADVKNISKRYVRETFEDMSMFIKNDRPIYHYIKSYNQKVKDFVVDNDRRIKNGWDRDKFIYEHKAFKVIARNIISNMSKLSTFSDSKVPTSWITATKAADKLKRGTIKKVGFDWKQNINVHELRYRDYGGGITSDSTPYIMKNLSVAFKKLTVYDEKGSDKLRTLYSYLKREQIKIIEVAPTKLKLLKNVDNFIKLEDFMSTDYTLIRNIGTVEFLKREMPFLKDLASINNLEYISERLAQVIYDLKDFVQTYESAANRHSDNDKEKELIAEIYSICEEKNYFNESIRGLFDKHKKELLNAKFLIDMAPMTKYSGQVSIPKERINMLVDYVLIRKLIRPSVKAVVKLKEETIYNIKPELKTIEQDEDNED